MTKASITNKNCLAKKYKSKNTYTYTKRYETTNYTVLSLLECKNFSRSIEYTVRLKAASDEKSVLAGSEFHMSRSDMLQSSVDSFAQEIMTNSHTKCLLLFNISIFGCFQGYTRARIHTTYVSTVKLTLTDLYMILGVTVHSSKARNSYRKQIVRYWQCSSIVQL